MSGHTPGPWKFREIPEGMFENKSWTVDYTDDQEQILDHVYCEADAHLIAAAPDLLEALQACWVLLQLQRGGEVADIAKAAIAKAKGEAA